MPFFFLEGIRITSEVNKHTVKENIGAQIALENAIYYVCFSNSYVQLNALKNCTVKKSVELYSP